MKKSIDVIMNPVSFPGQVASDSEKATQEYGLRIGQAIQNEWFDRAGGSCRYYNNWIEYHKLRLYARGEQSVAKYKSELAVDGDLSYLNLDWTPVPIIPKFVDIVVNGMNDRLFEISAYAQDAMSSEKRLSHQEMIETDMVAKELLMQTEEQFGVNAFSVDPETLPNNDQELALYMQLKYKPAIEIAEETAINTILDENHYNDTRKRFDYDIATIGLGICKHTFLPAAGVKVDYVDPANVVYSYTEDPYFKDCFYWGEVKRVPLTELYKIKPDLTDEDIKEIQQYASAWYEYYPSIRAYEGDLFEKDAVTLLYYNYKTTKKIVHKKKKTTSGGEKVIRKDEGFNPEPDENDRFEKLEKRIDVWYDGIMVLGSPFLLKWEMSKNMVRPKSASQQALPNYIAVAPRMYKGVIESLVRRMTTFADLIQITHLKLQQVISRMVPDGVYIDADGLNEVDLGNGGAYNPEDALRLYFQTGSVIGRSFTQDGEYNHARIPIQELNSNSGQAKISSLVGTYNHYMNMLRDVTGLNQARDASTPDPNSLVGIQKLAALNSNTATRHILEGSLYLTRALSEALSLRISDILEYAPFKEEFSNQIGKYNVSILEDVKNLYLHDFGIFIEVSPDEEEKAQLEANIQMALSREMITLEDAIDIREIKNLKLANELLKVKRQDKERKDQEREQQKMQMQAQVNMQSQEAAAQSKMQAIQAETQAKIQIEEAESQFSIQKLQVEAQLKKELMYEEFQMQMQLKGVEAQGLKDREDSRETAKADRISQQNTQQSQLINQRKEGAPPVNFESNEDSLDGFDLAEFEPR
jgi:hypothetical protein